MKIYTNELGESFEEDSTELVCFYNYWIAEKKITMFNKCKFEGIPRGEWGSSIHISYLQSSITKTPAGAMVLISQMINKLKD